MARIKKEDYNELNSVKDTGSGMDRSVILKKIDDSLRNTVEGFLPNSKYSITLSAFSRIELIRLQGLVRRDEIFRKEIYEIIHSHIVKTSIGNLTLEEFITHTSFLDLDTLAYLMYSATFKDKGSYSFTCNNKECNHAIEVELNNKSLIEVNDLEKYNKMRDIETKRKRNIKDIIEDEEHFVNKREYLLLDDSKVKVKLSEPSLADDAWTMRFSTDERLIEDLEVLEAIECIVEFGMPIPETDDYLVVSDKESIIDNFYKFNYSDQQEILDAVDEIMYSSDINYKIKEVTCGNCGTVYTDIPISMSNILFYLIYIAR